MARSCPAKLVLVACLAVQAGQIPSALADSQAGRDAHSRNDYSPAIVSELRLRAFEGDPVAQTRLAHLYADGRGVPQNYSEAIDWYRRAALQGHQPARKALESLGVPLITEGMISGDASQAPEDTPPEAGKAGAPPKQINHDRNIVTINIITNRVASPRRHATGFIGAPAAILHPRKHFKSPRHPKHRHVDAKPEYPSGESVWARSPGEIKKPYPNMGTGRVYSQSPGIGRISTRRDISPTYQIRSLQTPALRK